MVFIEIFDPLMRIYNFYGSYPDFDTAMGFISAMMKHCEKHHISKKYRLSYGIKSGEYCELYFECKVIRKIRN